ncbi:class II aldolase/adducin family protein [Paenibacillus yanchengensis]|uniref:Class II aldolase/adducin family protein n=1 Tax=Paenibacillus yanchengensis TaxID=2035833 RepID=A0ABW4YPD2_9BACL
MRTRISVEHLHPAEQLLLLMERIYQHGLTTTSGGNLSIRDQNGDIWITPAGVDKGSLTIEDMVCVKQNGQHVGKHKPSSEFPFHQLIYKSRPDLGAIVHAHPPALVAFSIVRKVPDTRLLPNERQICGEIGIAPYALPGSIQLGQNIADVFARGINSVMLENHGVVVGGANLFEAFQIFETLDFCARLEIEASRVGEVKLLTDEQFELVRNKRELKVDIFPVEPYNQGELEIREEMCRLIKRSYSQKLFTSTQGTFSQRINKNDFIITPFGIDRNYLEPDQLVKVIDGQVEQGKRPSKSILLHQAIYDQHPHIDSIIIAHPPNIMSFAVTDKVFDSKTIPESYILLRGTPKLPFDAVYNEPEKAAAVFTECTPIALVENNCIIVTGQSLLNTFDRLEVAEYSAKSILAAQALGDIVHIDEQRIDDLKVAFNLA